MVIIKDLQSLFLVPSNTIITTHRPSLFHYQHYHHQPHPSTIIITQSLLSQPPPFYQRQYPTIIAITLPPTPPLPSSLLYHHHNLHPSTITNTFPPTPSHLYHHHYPSTTIIPINTPHTRYSWVCLNSRKLWWWWWWWCLLSQKQTFSHRNSGLQHHVILFSSPSSMSHLRERETETQHSPCN